MPRPVLRTLLALTLGLLTTFATTFALAYFTTIPTYPRITTGAFLRWDRPWQAVEAHRFGLVHIWWGDLTESEAQTASFEIFERLKPQLAALGERIGFTNLPLPAKMALFRAASGIITLFVTPPPAREIVERYRIQAAENQLQGRTSHPLKLRQTARPWGTFAGAEPPPPQYTMGSDACIGWPVPCLWYQIFTTFNIFTMSTVTDELRGGLTIRGNPESHGDRYRALPYRPYYPGLALNTAFYASLFALLLFAPPALRRHLRLRRGHCPRCGYDVQSDYLAPCPECGRISYIPVAPPPRWPGTTSR